MAEDTPSNNTPDVTNDWYDSQLPVWIFLQDMLDGQDAVKTKTTTYLPQEPAELGDDYDRRLARSLFFEDYRDCVVNLTGMVFRKPPSLSDDVPELIRGREAEKNEEGEITQAAKEGLAENIDNAGTHINVFLQRVFQDGFFGHTFIVVDTAPMSTETSNAAGVPTAQDQLNAGARSYWVQRKAIDTLNWRWAIVNGRTIPTQATFQECTKETDGLFGETEVTRWRVYRLDENGDAEWQLWEQQTVSDSGDVQIVMTASGKILTKKGQPLKRLPIAVHYGEYEGFWKSRPPLKGIADISRAYYQKYSDLTSIEHHTCAVTLCITGADDQSGDKTLGGNRVIYLPQLATAEFLTVDGDSIPALERDLEALEKRMVQKGLDFIREKEKQVPPTATEVMLAYTQRTSKLSMMTRSLKDCAEQALSITAEMEGLDQGGSISLGVDENSLSLSWEQIRILSELNERGQLSLQSVWALMERADQLPEDFDPRVELNRLDEAAEKQMERNAKQFDSGLESTP